MKIFSDSLKSLYPRVQISSLLDWISPYRRPVIFIVHILAFVLSNYLAFYIRFEGNIASSDVDLFLKYLPLLICLRIAFLLLFKLDKGLWRYTGITDLYNIGVANALSSLVFFLIVYVLLGVTKYPRSVYGIDWLLSVTILAVARLLAYFHHHAEYKKSAKKKAVIVGAGDAGEMLLRDITRSNYYQYDIVGFIDEDLNKRGFTIRGVPILGTLKDVGRIIVENEPDEFIVAIPSAPAEDLETIIKELRRFGKPIKKVPSLWSILSGRSSIAHIEVMKPEDILFRAPIYDESFMELRNDFSNKRVMITGAAGSIGSELARQVAGLAPSKLILFERHEEGLYRLGLQLGRNFPELNIHPVIGDITDKERVSKTLEEFRPEIIFHAAAYKHVPLMEYNPSEAFKVNVIGTRILAEKTRDYNVDKFILISTDKAIDPTSVMGKTKKIAEEILYFLSNQRSHAESNAPHATTYGVVRFGNVLESSGSVVPLFIEQIKSGGPLTITDPNVSRYFMTVDEAALLVLRASGMADGNGQTFVLDMGEPIKILDLAKRLITLYGYVPEKDIEIIFTGLRPGEKLHEQLFCDHDTIEKTAHPKILRVSPNNSMRKAVSLDELIRRLSSEYRLPH